MYPRGFLAALLDSEAVTDATRRALTARVAAAPSTSPAFFTPGELGTLQAICARLIPQPPDRAPIDITAVVDERLAHGMGNGWRYVSMPPDGEAYRQSLQAVDETARARFGHEFTRLRGDQQDRVLLAVQFDEVTTRTWTGLSPSRFLEELLAEIAEVYYSHPVVQEEIGYAGFADARGWTRVGLDQLDDVEPRPQEARRA